MQVDSDTYKGKFIRRSI